MRWPTVEEQTEGRDAALFDADALAERHVGRGEFRGMEFLHVNAKTIINVLPASSRMSFRYTINPYRGCSHACSYCFARPTHDYLGLGTGEDFERKIVVKVNAVELLRAELSARRWSGHHIAMGTNTDPYQRCEGKYHLTRGVVEVLTEAANPFSILTKSTLILRDLELLAKAARQADVRVNLSIGTLDEQVWRLSEPGTPPPRSRVEAVRRLNEAGVPCGVLVAPILPGLSDRDEQLHDVVEACVEAGAVAISSVALHLRPGVREHYLRWLGAVRPDLVAATEARYRGSYLPKADQRALSEQVRSVVESARRDRWREVTAMRGDDGPVAGGLTADETVSDRVRLHMGGEPMQSVSSPPATPISEQLGLGW
ncbi:MAG: radical SAM protein [Acidimicrobiaceae bacterium]|nr:radical SAM protein [Acidimicrobiaceae bacterium]